MSTEVREYYDYDNNRGVLHQVQGGLPFYLYYNYNSKEILSIFPTLGIICPSPISRLVSYLNITC